MNWNRVFAERDIRLPLEKLYQECYDPVCNYLIQLGASADDAADVFQEAMLILVQKLREGKFNGESSIQTFLTGIARFCFMQQRRSQIRRAVRNESFTQTYQEVVQDNIAIEDKEKAVWMKQLLAQTGEVCQKLLFGFYYEEKSFKELLPEFSFQNEQVLRNQKSKCMKKLKAVMTNSPYSLHQNL